MKYKLIVAGLNLLLSTQFVNAQDANTLSLAGKWRIVLDGNYKDWPQKPGVERGWYKSALPTNKSVELLNKIYFKNSKFSVNDWIDLPGSTDEAKIGIPLTFTDQFTPGLERIYTYDDAFWIQKKVVIPNDWQGKQVTFFMERLLGASQTYWDGKLVGGDYGYSYPHQVIVSESIIPGEHTLTVLINKSDQRYAHGGHNIYNANGASWNGVIGRIELIGKNAESNIKNTWIYPNVKAGNIEVRLSLNNQKSKERTIRFYVKKQSDKNYIKLPDVSIKDSVATTLSIPQPIALWNEFTPNLYELKSELIENGKVIDTKVETFGMRQIATSEGYITINNEKVFMRGTLDCGSYPLNGYPDMKKEEWTRVMNICKQYGLNHIRFHTWCPPEAAFDAADEAGIYLQAELCGIPYAEINRILDTYGNHPSFCMLSLNNERAHDETTIPVVVAAQRKDNRHLYTCTTQPVKPDCIDDFYVSAWGNRKIDEWPGKQRIVGITWGGGDVVHSSRFNTTAPETAFNYSQELKGINAPIISHEIGQWAMFPRLDEIAKYSGVMRNTNYERIRNAIDEEGMLPQAKDLADASGKLSAILYKEEIESALRTPNFAGFQLLDLHDYQGQYISIVGILDGFWNSKGLVTPEQHHQYCNAITPLAKMKKRVFLNNEMLVADLDIANYSVTTLKGTKPMWQLCDGNNQVMQQGSFEKRDVVKGGLTSFNPISISLKGITRASKMTFKVSIPNSKIENTWDVWVYPASNEPQNGSVHLLTAKDMKEVEEQLSKGEKVLLQLDSNSLELFRESCFTTIFWNSIHKWPQRAHTMGVLCNPKHPIFNDFPTDMHSNWQWWDIAMNAFAMNMNDLPKEISPLVQVVDSYIVNDKLAYIWECKVGNGKLLVSSINLKDNLNERTASKQLKFSILNYMNSESFDPPCRLDMQKIKNLLPK